MKKLLAAVLSLCLALSLCAIPAMAATADFTTLIEECLTTEVSTAITENLTLPEAWGEGTSITWESSDPSVIGNDGKVTRGIEDVTVTLTAKDVTDASNTKVLTFTVLSLFKKVWYNNNFYTTNADVIGKAIGYKGGEATGNPYEFVEKTAETDGNAGLIRLGNYSDEKLSIEANPLKANDYAVRIEENHALYGHYYALALPSIDDSELPSGDVKVSLRISSASAAGKKFRVGFNGSLNTNLTHIYWNYNASTTNSGYFTWINGATPKCTQNIATPTGSDGNVYCDATATFTVSTNMNDDNTNTLKLESISSGQIINAGTYNPYNHTDKIENEVLKHISFGSINEKVAGRDSYTAYVDDIVIMTETTEIPGETAADRLAVYKRLLTGKLNEAIADKANVTDDINLNLLDITGYDVAWESDNTSAIVIDTVNKKADVQLTEIIKDVTLTGTITHDGATDTIALPLTVKPYGAATVSYWGNRETDTANTCVITYENAATGSYAANELNTTHRSDSGFSVAQEGDNKFATVTGNANVIGSLKYGSGGWTGCIGGKYKTISFDAKINKPTVDKREVIRTAVTVGTQKWGIAQLIIPYVVNADGTYSKSKWYIADGGNNSENFRYVDDAKLETLPGLDEWFNIQIVTNTISSTYDIYINGVKLFDHAAKFPAGQNDSTTANFYTLAFNAVASLLTDDYKLTTICWDNIEILNNDAGALGNVSADLMLASIDSVNDELKATEANGTAIAWTATGDATVSGNALVKSKDFGLGETTVTATATVPGKGTLSRVYNLYYGTEIKAVDAAEGMLNSIKYVSDVDAAGYIAYYNGDNALLRVAPIALQAGRNTRVFEGVTLPEGYASLKVFAWNENLSPLSFAYPAN